MRISTRKSVKRKKYFVALVAALAVSAYGFFAFSSGLWPFPGNSVDNTSSNDTSRYTEHDPNFDIDNVDPIDKTPTQYEDNSGSKPKTGALSGVINYSSVVDDKLVIRVTINNDPLDGTCRLSLTSKSTSKTVTRSASIISNPSSSTCDGFSIPVKELSKGLWNIVIQIESNGVSGKISGEVSV